MGFASLLTEVFQITFANYFSFVDVTILKILWNLKCNINQELPFVWLREWVVFLMDRNNFQYIEANRKLL